MAGGAGSEVAVGGMRTKLDAAEMVMRSGERLIIAGARTPDVLVRILEGEEVGTVFDPRGSGGSGGARLEGRKRWIAFFRRTMGVIRIDAGAARALRERGSSLLAIGVRDVEGEFAKGAPVKIVDEGGAEIARGLVNYAAADLRKIAGRKSGEFAAILGGAVYEEVVHRDNLVLA